MADDRTLEKLRAAYAAWSDSRAGSIETWAELFAPEGSVRSVAEEHLFAGVRRLDGLSGRDAAVAYLSDIQANWTMERYALDRLICDEDDVVAVVDCAFTHKVTGKRFEGQLVDVWRFRDGAAVSVQEFLDTAALVQAATP